MVSLEENAPTGQWTAGGMLGSSCFAEFFNSGVDGEEVRVAQAFPGSWRGWNPGS